MPPSGFNQNAVKDILIFVQSCYTDLLRDVHSGKFQTYDEAIQYELAQIKKALEKLHIDVHSNLIER